MQETAVTNDHDGHRRSELQQTAADVTVFSQITDPILSLLYAYWDGKRGDRRFPGRSDLDPVDIPILLPSVFLVAVRRDPFDLVFRLAGTVLTGCYGSAMTGERLIDLPGSATTQLYQQAARAVRSGRPVLLSGPLRTRADAFQRADHLLLPLGESPGRVDMLIGGAIFRSYPIGERPERQSGMAKDPARRAARPALRSSQPLAPLPPATATGRGRTATGT